MRNSPVTKVIPPGVDPEVRIRTEWSINLHDAMRDRGVDKYELLRRLARHDIYVTRQAIESWLAGKTSPRPHVQQAIGTALDIPARLIFRIENLPVAS